MDQAIKPKIGKNVLGCAGIALAVLLLLLALLAFALAKTGVFNVPVFSGFYRGPEPTRVVATSSPMTLEGFRDELANKFLAQARLGKKPPYTIEVSEKELTAALRGGIEEGVRGEEWNESDAQAVIRQDRIEVFLTLKKETQTAELLIDFVPKVENGGVQLEPVSFRFGDYPIPVSLAQRIAGTFFKRDFGVTTLSVGEAQLSQITLKDGVMEVTASPAGFTP